MLTFIAIVLVLVFITSCLNLFIGWFVLETVGDMLILIQDEIDPNEQDTTSNESSPVW